MIPSVFHRLPFHAFLNPWICNANAKMSLLNCVPYVLPCQRALRAYVRTCQRVLCAYLLMCLACSRAHVPMCLACLRGYMIKCSCLACPRVNVPCVLCVPTRSRAIITNDKYKFSMTCFPYFFVIVLCLFLVK